MVLLLFPSPCGADNAAPPFPGYPCQPGPAGHAGTGGSESPQALGPLRLRRLCAGPGPGRPRAAGHVRRRRRAARRCRGYEGSRGKKMAAPAAFPHPASLRLPRPGGSALSPPGAGRPFIPLPLPSPPPRPARRHRSPVPEQAARAWEGLGCL